jgi:hypothetical protein
VTSGVAAGIGHNNGPSMDAGVAWRTHCWTRARADLLPHLPIEILRNRVARARDLGLDYRTYASVRAASGHDVVAFLFSSNALRLRLRNVALPPDRAARLASLTACGRTALAQGRLDPALILRANLDALDACHPAPALLASFPDARAALRAALGAHPRDGVILIGEGTLERDWCAAGRLAGFVSADHYFRPV